MNEHSAPIVLILILLILVVCSVAVITVGSKIGDAFYETSYSKNRIREQRAAASNAIFEQNMEERRQTQAVRLAAQENLIWYGHQILMVVTGVGVVIALYWAGGAARADVKRRYLMADLIPLDTQTHQYPLLTRGDWWANPNNGKSAQLGVASEPHPQLTEGSIKVQVAGVLADSHTSSADTALIINKHTTKGNKCKT
jgi:hypothetical protein